MKTKKQLLFVCYGLGIGGIEKCLVNLLNILPEDAFDVDVLLMNPQYQMKPQIRRNVRFYDEFEYVLYSGGAMEAIRSRGGILKNLGKVIRLIPFRYLEQHNGKAWKLYRPLKKHYDIAVAYSQNGYALYYVIDKVKASRKVLWYHNGSYDVSGEEKKLHEAYYPKFDKVVTVSDYCVGFLKEALPAIADKLLVLWNLCDTEEVLEKAGAFVPAGFEKNRTHIVTVGRMAEEKGVFLALEACRILRRQGLDICWHWVGNGPMEQKVRREIQRLGLEDCFIPEGDQDNPYPYMEHCDVYVQPSHYESYSNTVSEAMVLRKPMVITNVGGMGGRLTDGVNGFVVSVDAPSIAGKVAALVQNPVLRERISREMGQLQEDTRQAEKRYFETVFI